MKNKKADILGIQSFSVAQAIILISITLAVASLAGLMAGIIAFFIYIVVTFGISIGLAVYFERKDSQKNEKDI